MRRLVVQLCLWVKHRGIDHEVASRCPSVIDRPVIVQMDMNVLLLSIYVVYLRLGALIVTLTCWWHHKKNLRLGVSHWSLALSEITRLASCEELLSLEFCQLLGSVSVSRF